LIAATCDEYLSTCADAVGRMVCDTLSDELSPQDRP
jgi:hypothetical protein